MGALIICSGPSREKIFWLIKSRNKEHLMSTAIIGGIVAVVIAILVIVISSGRKNKSKD